MKRFRKPVLALVIAMHLTVFFTSPAIAGMIGLSRVVAKNRRTNKK
ncbi:MAG: hypothetical protein ACLP9S_16400 [Syntrophales bacterium]